jgi:acyl transferase domain-containing protein/acyl carrier protein
MSDPKAAVLFPGQGAFSGAALKDVAAEYPQIAETLAEIDAVAKKQLDVSLTETLLGESAPNIEELMKGSPDVLQLAIYATSIGLYRILQTYGFRPTVMIGHSLGEISGMVCAGAFSVRDGAAIVCHRVQALRALGDDSGYMVALGAGATRTRRMLELLEVKRSAIAVENEDRQTVVSGDAKELAAITDLAKVLRVPAVRIYSPYPFHSPVLAPITGDFAARLRELEEQPLAVPVYSPILGRYYDESDRLTDHLADHLTHPVRFAAAVWTVHDEGINRFVECGALDTLSGIVKRILADSQPEVIPCLVPGPTDLQTLAAAIEKLTGKVVGPRPIARDLGDMLPAGTDATTMGAFFAEHGDRVQSFVEAEFESFRAARGIAEVEPDEAVAGAALEEAPAAPGGNGGLESRDELFAELVTLYATALEYPEEVFTEDVALEAELGVDSVKQAELIARVAERYEMPPRPEDFRLGDYDTLGKVTDFVFSQVGAVASPA